MCVQSNALESCQVIEEGKEVVQSPLRAWIRLKISWFFPLFPIETVQFQRYQPLEQLCDAPILGPGSQDCSTLAGTQCAHFRWLSVHRGQRAAPYHLRSSLLCIQWGGQTMGTAHTRLGVGHLCGVPLPGAHSRRNWWQASTTDQIIWSFGRVDGSRNG